MSVSADEGVRAVPRRVPLRALSFHVASALVSTVLAGAALVAALAVGSWRPEPLLSIILFAAAPICATISIPVLVVRGRAEQLPAVRWLGAGVAVAWFALTLQLISFPTVSPGGGIFGTSGTGSVLLYLIAHVAMFGAALAGALGAHDRWRGRFLVIGFLLCVLVAMDLLPAPSLLAADQRFAPAVLVAEWALTAIGAVAVWRWVVATGTSPTPLVGWSGVSLLLLTYEVALNAVAGQRYTALWWSSLSLRVVAFAVLGFGCLGYVLLQLGRVERYSDDELIRSDTELTSRAAVIDRLLTHARRLTTSQTPTDVAQVLATTAQQITGADTATVSHVVEHPPSVVRLATAGPWHRSDTGALTTAESWGSGAPPIFLDDPVAVAARLGDGGRSEIGAVAVLPLRVRDLVIGVLEVAGRRPRTWSAAERELLQGLADQAGPVLSRARLALRESQAAQTLQRSLLPTGLPRVDGVCLAAVYRPAELGTHVGGDWYDVWTLSDGRLALAIGDVNGKGLTAAATSGRLRAAMRALAAADPTPSTVLRRLDDLESRDGLALIATVTYAVLDPATGRVCLARAGHTPTLLTRPGHGSEVLQPDGSAIGLSAGTFTEHTAQLGDGGMLLMFTDGLVERRELTPDEQLDRLLGAVATMSDLAPEALPDVLMDHFQPQDDDVAILVAAMSRAR